MQQNLLITKRNGKQERINLDKIHKVLNWAAEGLKNISISQVELKSRIQFYNGIKTINIHETIVKAAADLISETSPDYQYMAARLAIFHLRKKAYGQFNPPTLYEHVKKIVKLGKYDKNLLIKYSVEEYATMNNFIDHWRDMNFSYAAVQQLEGKYLIQNRINGRIYESAQFLYILISACLFSNYPHCIRMKYVKQFYDAISTFKISLPTPIMAGVRTPTRQFSSCVLIECADNLNSINATSSAIIKYVSQRAGIGINAGQIRAVGSPIRSGEAFHTGCIPFYKHFQTAVKSCSQGGIRGGAATLFYPIWHFEIESLIVLKNNRGVEENRVRHIDYGLQINKLMYQRMISGKHITLFSPSDVPNLYNSFFSDQKVFKKLYIKYENDVRIRKKRIKAIDLFALIMQERTSTGRIYIQNVDHCNLHSAFNPKKA
ncbi:MAG TPA: class 1a ribonucleoside-diphosphate reductase subunit alpha, partial [Buchnera sp. (in: enterobacteria)]|nr:class 1a ribonucleoside-diphosphate reductase subunit alpha [Buchnera sp. (in: enterobacteria)]